MVGRFVPENNVETIIREFMKSGTSRKLALITTDNEKLYRELEKKLGFSRDKRICFTGSVYDQELLKKIRYGGHQCFQRRIYGTVQLGGNDGRAPDVRKMGAGMI